MIYVDTHCHFNSSQLYQDYDAYKKEAEKQGVKLFIVPGFDLESSKIAIKLAEQYDNVYAAIGFHPTEIKSYGDEEYNWLEENVKHPKVVAIGEIGYDFHWDTTTEEEQTKSLIRQIEIAKKVNKPLIIHSRDAMNKTYQMLKDLNAFTIGGVMHSFSGSLEMAKEFIKLNFYIGLGGPVTFTNAKDPKLVAEGIDVNYLLSETDAPYLSPHPLRGKMNAPRNIPIIVDQLSKLTKIEIDELKLIILNNTKRLFNIKEV